MASGIGGGSWCVLVPYSPTAVAEDAIQASSVARVREHQEPAGSSVVMEMARKGEARADIIPPGRRTSPCAVQLERIDREPGRKCHGAPSSKALPPSQPRRGYPGNVAASSLLPHTHP